MFDAPCAYVLFTRASLWVCWATSDCHTGSYSLPARQISMPRRYVSNVSSLKLG